MTPSSPARPGWLLLAGWLLLLAAPLRAAEGGFSATLSTEEQSATGLATLTVDERTALDRLVAADAGFARQENLTSLDGTFTARHTAAARRSAGLERLTPEQLTKLNELVAAAIAAKPQPKERPRLKESDVLVAKRKPEIHGSVSVAYGWGRGGRDFRASSLWLDYYDPESRLGLGVGITTFDGDGFYGYYPDYYPGVWDYYDAPFYPASRIYLEDSARGDFRGDYFPGDGSSFRGSGRADFSGRGGRRH